MKEKKEIKSSKVKNILILFVTFLKIGAFTFGGGYAMIPLIENECVSKRNWITEEDMTTMITVAESTPGPLAINSATFVGVHIAGFFGAFFATLGVVIPSFIIIFLISLFFNNIMEYEIVAHAFMGIKCSVAVLIILSAISLIKKSNKDVFSICITVITFILATLIDIFAFNFSTIFLILAGGVFGLSMYFVRKHKRGKNK